jgi:hypothetical protein
MHNVERRASAGWQPTIRQVGQPALQHRAAATKGLRIAAFGRESWSRKEEALLGTLPDPAAAKQLGRWAVNSWKTIRHNNLVLGT